MEQLDLSQSLQNEELTRHTAIKQTLMHLPGINSAGNGERQSTMATMTTSWSQFGDVGFEDVEENVELVKVGVKFANRAGFVVRVFWKFALLSYAFAEAIERQGKLIDTINGPASQNFNVQQLNDLAARIERLVQLNDELLGTASPRTREFKPWMKMLADIRVQRDTLESIGESMRSATDSEYQALLVMALETIST